MTTNEALPAYAQADIKRQLLAQGASGTIYAMVTPESERAIMRVVDGLHIDDLERSGQPLDILLSSRRGEWLSRYHEPWTQKQDDMHVAYFDSWLTWSSPVVDVDASAFSHRYPTAGASEAIVKLMAEYATQQWARGRNPSVHVFEGEYEGFASFAAALSVPVRRHSRDDWSAMIDQVDENGQVWISQPSSIDGGVWPRFDEFLGTMAALRPDVQIIPDLSYVGSVADPYQIALDYENVPAFVISHSKPFGGYYHRCGGAFSRTERGTLFGNRWFKNLTSLAWGVEMMSANGVFHLPRRYRAQQDMATALVAQRLGVEGLRPAGVNVLATAPVPETASPLLSSLIRGAGSDRKLRICLTPTMTRLIAPEMAPSLEHLILTRED
ncbi:hypothetical protein [Sphingomonas sp. 3-13AW]|uniref:hypothetical protein n=1 Tax=Sphingomonas sp. 3-13AW TaxID=3050450 RepID=UPI003BB70E7B